MANKKTQMAMANIAWEAEEIFVRLLAQTPWQGEWHPSTQHGIALARWGYNVFILDKENQGVYCVTIGDNGITLQEVLDVDEETFTGPPSVQQEPFVENVLSTILQRVEEAGLGSHLRILVRV